MSRTFSFSLFLCFGISFSLSIGSQISADDGGYRVLDPRLQVRVLATIPDESLAQVVADRAGRLFLGGREGVFVVESDAVKPGLKPVELYRERGDQWFMGIVPYGPDLYIAKHNAVLRLEGASTKRDDPKTKTAKPVVWGFPKAKTWGVHQTLHDLKIGPDGRFYLTMGDLFPSFGDFRRPDHWSVVRIETAGTPARREIVGIGGLFRFDPDGSNLSQQATGLRNANGFDFNSDLDAFTTDNDHESDARYVPSRLLFLAPGGFYGWPRNWMFGWPEEWPTMAGLGREAPVGLAVYGDSRLPDEYRGQILSARWGHQSIDRFAPSRQGAGYSAREIPWLICPQGKRPMAVAVGRGGRVYALVAHMQTNADSPIYTADLLEIDRTAPQSAPPFQPLELADASIERLHQELESADFSRRFSAHAELARRGGAALRPAIDRIRAGDRSLSGPAAPHWIRLAGLSADPDAVPALRNLLSRTDEETRYQAVQALMATIPQPPTIDWGDLLARESSPRVRRAILSGLWAHGDRAGSPRVWAEAAALANSADPVLRLLAARAIGEHAPASASSPTSTTTPGLGQVLADGFALTIPVADSPLPSALTLADEPYEDTAGVATRRAGLFTIDAWWRALEKTPRHEQALNRLIRALDSSDPTVRTQALRSLVRLDEARTVPALERLLDQRDRQSPEVMELAMMSLTKLDAAKAAPRLTQAFQDARPQVRRAAAEALVSRDAAGPELTVALKTLALDAKTEPRLRASALERLANVLSASELEPVLNAVDPQAGWGVIGTASRLAASKLPAPAAARWLTKWLESSSEDARQAASQALGTGRKPELLALARQRAGAESSVMVLRHLVAALLANPDAESDAALARVWRTRKDLDSAIRQRIADHLSKRPGYETIAQSQAAEPTASANVPDEFANIDWSSSWRRGDRERGRTLFQAKTGVSCAACHRFEGQGGSIGPSLEEADRRLNAPYIVESILKPSAEVAPLHQPWAIETQDGQVLTGVILQETADRILLGLNDGTTREVETKTIQERKSSKISIMPEGLIKSPDDLRDVLSYLLTPVGQSR